MKKIRESASFLINVIFLLSLGSTQNLFAQAGSEGDLDDLVSDTKTDLLVVVGGGLAGAVLGLSTLSFVEEPKDHTRNILVGASLGIIAGVGFVAFSQATKTRDMMYEEEGASPAQVNGKSFSTVERVAWHQNEQNGQYTHKNISPYQLNYHLKF